MTSFLPLEPMGAGTRETESLLSIFARATLAHTTSLAPMARLLSRWWQIERGRESKRLFARVYGPLGTGLGSYAEDTDTYIEVLSEALRIPSLHRHTLVCLRASAAPNGVGAVRGRGWCNACFQDDARRGVPIYERLLWTMQPITRCVEHRVELTQECPACGIIQTFPHKSGQLGICYRCESSLFDGFNGWRPALQPSFGERDCCELIAAIASGELDKPFPDPFSVFQLELNEILSPVSTAVENTAPTSGSKRAIAARSRPTLTTMLRRTHVAGVSLVQILTSPVEAARAAGELELERRETQGIPRPRHPKQILCEARQALEHELAKGNGEEIPPLTEILKSLGVSKGFLWHHLNSLLRAYGTRRMRESMKRIRRRFDAMQAELDGGLLNRYLAGELGSQDAVVDLLVERCGSGKAAARRQLVNSLARHAEHQRKTRVQKR